MAVIPAALPTVVRSDDPPSPATSAPAELAPPIEALKLLQGADPERQLDGFASWCQWRSSLSPESRRAADAYLARPQWLDMLGNVAIYEMVDKRRRRAYELLADLGGQRVFPFMVWGIDEESEEGFLSRFVGSVNPGLVLRRFFREQGDPTVIDHLPDWQWQDVRLAIGERWSGRAAPAKTWEPLDPKHFKDDLGNPNPARRRLAVRALTNSPRLRKERVALEFRPLLSDPDKHVIQTVVEAFEIVSCPSARGRLKELAEDDAMPIEARRSCLKAIVRCGTAQLWTAEWMIANLSDWPEEMDETVLACLIELNRGKKTRRERFVESIQQAADRADDERTRAVVARALEQF